MVVLPSGFALWTNGATRRSRPFQDSRRSVLLAVPCSSPENPGAVDDASTAVALEPNDGACVGASLRCCSEVAPSFDGRPPAVSSGFRLGNSRPVEQAVGGWLFGRELSVSAPMSFRCSFAEAKAGSGSCCCCCCCCCSEILRRGFRREDHGSKLVVAWLLRRKGADAKLRFRDAQSEGLRQTLVAVESLRRGAPSWQEPMHRHCKAAAVAVAAGSP